MKTLELLPMNQMFLLKEVIAILTGIEIKSVKDLENYFDKALSDKEKEYLDELFFFIAVSELTNVPLQEILQKNQDEIEILIKKAFNEDTNRA